MGKIETGLGNIRNTPLSIIQAGYAKTIKEFWEKFVEPNLFDESLLLGWFDELSNYIERDDSVFVLRYGNSNKRKGVKDSKYLRRGFLTKFSSKNTKHSYVYTDNDYATIICNLCVNNIVPEKGKNEFYSLMVNADPSKTFPLHFNGSSSFEREKAAFRIKLSGVKIGSYGYKVSHIADVGKDYYDPITKKTYGMKDIVSLFFADSDYDDWKKHGDRYYREDGSLIEKGGLKERIAKAVFLRFSCPLNYVLTPKRTCFSTAVKMDDNDIGEDRHFLAYATEMFFKKYPKLYQKYLDMLMLPPNYNRGTPNPGDFIIDLEYGLDINPKANGSSHVKSNGLKQSKSSLINSYYKYLIDTNYKDSTAMSYRNAIIAFLKREKCEFELLLVKIDELIFKYSNGSDEDISFGNKSKRTYINALKKAKDFSNSTIKE